MEITVKKIDTVYKPGTKLYKASVLYKNKILEYQIDEIIEYNYDDNTCRVVLTSIDNKEIRWMTFPNDEFQFTKKKALTT